jgi:phage baseplate assembly protein V
MDANSVGRLMRPLMHRVKLATARAKVLLARADRKTQRLDVGILAGEYKRDLEHFQPYGFTSAPLEGAEALVHFLAGNRSLGIASVVSDGRSRPRTLGEGEVAIYHASDDPTATAEAARHRITLAEGKLIVRVDSIDIKCGPSTLQMDAAGVRVTGPRIDLN